MSKSLGERLGKLSPEKQRLLSKLLEKKGVEIEKVLLAPRPADAGPPPLSFTQRRLWLLQRLEPRSSAMNIPQALRLKGRLDLRALAASVAAVVRRHEILRTTYGEGEDEPVQLIHPPEARPIPLVDLAAVPAERRQAVADRWIREEARRPFDLEFGSVFRLLMLRLGREEHIALFTLHHIATDEVSGEIFIGELVRCYAAFGQRRAPRLPELPIQYADFAYWQRKRFVGKLLEERLHYWREQMADAPPTLDLPTDRPRTPDADLRAAIEDRQWPGALAAALEPVRRLEGATLFMVLLASWAALLSRITGQLQVVIGVPGVERQHREIEGLIGCFINMLVIRVDLRGNPTFRQLLRQVRGATLEAQTRQEIPFEVLVQELQPERLPGRTPLFQVVLNYEEARGGGDGGQAPGGGALPGLSVEFLGSGNRGAEFDLTLAFSVAPNAFGAGVKYKRDLFDRTRILRLLSHLKRLLEAVAKTPEALLSQFDLLTTAEHHQLVVEPRGVPCHTLSEEHLPALFARAVEGHGESAAVVSEGLWLSYGELDLRASRLSARLAELGVGPEVVVGICTDPCAELLVAILGVLRAGGAYLPLDRMYPKDRLRFQLEDSSCTLVLTREELRVEVEEIVGAGGQVLAVEELMAEGGPPASIPAVDSAGLAYVIYTSGSTGLPKGALLSHRTVCRLMVATKRFFAFDSSDVWSLFHSHAFDFSVWEIWGALAFGGRLVVVPFWIRRSAEDFATLLQAERVTVLNQTPSAFRELVQGHDALRKGALHTVVFGGEALAPQGLGPWLTRGMAGPRLVNMYGITETCVHVTGRALAPADREVAGSSPIGEPIPDLDLLLLGRHGRPAPLGVPGELCVGGPGLARGYLGRPGLTAERFVPHALGPSVGERLYRSGDLGVRRGDGELEYLGRIDHQVQLRGFRVELGEIESALLGAGRIAAALVLVKERESGPYLVAYLATEEELPEPADLREALAGMLPEYMIPTEFVVLDHLPLTPNGKVDRRALPEPEERRSTARAAYVAPRSPVEEILAQIWAEVLGLERVGIHDSFFDLGGHSLLATQVVSRIRQRLGLDLPLRVLFEAPTVAGLAARWEHLERESSGRPQPPPLVPQERPEDLPLSFAQQRLWFLDQLEPGSSVYNMPFAQRLRGPLDLAVLRRVTKEIVRRHEVLRTRFETLSEGEHAGRPVQRIESVDTLSFAVVDLSHLPAGRGQTLAHHLAAWEAQRPFDLSRGPLLRLGVVRLSAEEHILLSTMHHIVSDGWSLGVLLQEVVVLFEAFSEERPSPLPELPVQYADYALWQRSWLTGSVYDGEVEYWRQHLAGAPPILALPLDRARPPVQTFRGQRHGTSFSPELSQALRNFSQARGATLFMTLLSGFQLLLARYGSQWDVSVGTPIAGRRQVATEELIGFFVNTLVLRLDFSRLSGPSPTFGDLVDRVREVCLEGHQHQDLPFEEVVDALQPERNLSYSPLFQAFFLFQEMATPDTPGASSSTLSGLQAEGLSTSEELGVKFDLTLDLGLSGEFLEASLASNADLFDGTTIERLGRHLVALFASAMESPKTPLSRLDFLTPAENHQLRVEWNDTTPVRTTSDLPGRIAAICRERPASVAIRMGPHWVSYGELRHRASLLARRLRDLGVEPESKVGVISRRSVDLVVSLLGILEAGGVYVPLDPDHPAARLQWVMEDAELAALLADPAVDLRELSPKLPVLPLDGAPAKGGSSGAFEARHPEQGAYMIYTSGSTGRPKGVIVPDRGLLNLLEGMVETLGLGPGSVVLALTTPAFDISVAELLMPLLVGARLDLVPREITLDGALLDRELTTCRGTLLQATPTGWRLLLEGGFSPPEGFGTISTGEALPRSLARELVSRGLRPWNLYGPTEASIWSTGERVTSSSWRSTVGRPVAGMTAQAVSREFVLQPLGSRGELVLGGLGLARGYHHRPGKTASSFLPNPFGDLPGARLYRTRDESRLHADGRVEYLGRLDHQVKLRGFRIELGEIESALRAQASVEEAVVLLRSSGRSPRLAAYVVLSTDAPASPDALRKPLQEELPSYMVPADFVLLESMPLTPNGKVDRRALPEPEERRSTAGAAYVAPRHPVEEILAQIWAEVLGLEQVGIHDSFFDLGGHSLLATQVVSRIRQRLGLDLPLRVLFEAPTVALLAARWEHLEREASGRPQPPPLVPQKRPEDLPLSFAQQRLWFLDQLEPGSSVYNMPFAQRLHGPLDLSVLRRVAKEIVRRHEVLRTRFETLSEGEQAGRPVQRIESVGTLSFAVVDLSHLPAERGQALAHHLASLEAQRPFDLSRGPLLRLGVVRLSAEDHILLSTLHHIVSDGWSLGVLLQEVVVLFEAFSKGHPSPLPELSVQYADYALWQRSWLAGSVYDGEVEYWRQQLAGAPPLLALPLDRARPAAQTFRGQRHGTSFSPELSQALRNFSQARGATLFMTLLSGFQLLLARYGSQWDVSVGTPIAGRRQVATEGLIGFFVNTLVLRLDFSTVPGPSSNFGDLVDRVREVCLEGHQHQDLPFEEVVDALQPERNLSYSPLFQTFFLFQETATPETSSASPSTLGGLQTEGLSTSEELGVKFDLTLDLLFSGDRLEAGLASNADLFDGTTIERLGRHLVTLFTSAMAFPGTPFAFLDFLTPSENHQLRVEWKDTTAPSNGTPWQRKGVPWLCGEFPEALAIRQGQDWVSYGELGHRAGALARRLRGLGVGTESKVGVIARRSIGLVVGLLGILEAGGVYVPLDPDHPDARLRWVIEDAELAVLLVGPDVDLPKMAPELPVLSLDDTLDNVESSVGFETRHPEQGAYMIYTSGSTGRPKGVIVPDRGLLNLLEGMVEMLSVGPDAVVLSLTTPAFDISVAELLLPLLVGARLDLVPREVALDGALLQRELVTCRGTLMQATPTGWRLLLEGGFSPPEDFGSISTGEPLPQSLARELVSRGLRPWNLYGPTEASIWSTGERVISSSWRSTVGRPVAGMTAQAVSRELVLQPLGSRGELVLGGLGLARAYHRRPGRTASSFLPNPFGDSPGARLYRTGDESRLRADGRVEYLGRLDHQVKIRGFRIELGEIEAALRSQASVEEAVVLLRESGSSPRLVAYVVLSTPTTPDELKKALEDRLPHYMVPTDTVFLEAMPQTPNGKIDRRALPDIRSQHDAKTEIREPRNATERRLVELWRKVLEREAIGRDSNFFDHGGHSLSTVRLRTLIEREFEVEFPLAVLFRHPTPESIALWLRDQGRTTKPTTLVSLNSSGDKNPLFLVHPAGGTVFCYMDLVRSLDPERPVWGLQAPDLEGGVASPVDVVAMAALQVEELTAFRPEGPLLLGGWSLGGVLAYEMARQLLAQGRRVERLVLMDSVLAGRSWFRRTDQREILESFALHLGVPRKQVEALSAAIRGWGSERRLETVFSQALDQGLLPPDLGVPQMLELYRLFENHLRALESFRPQPYAGQLCLIQATDRDASEQRKVEKAWQRLVAGLEVHQIDGGHFDLLKPPRVRELASLLNTWLKA